MTEKLTPKNILPYNTLQIEKSSMPTSSMAKLHSPLPIDNAEDKKDVEQLLIIKIT